jgi:hypothetical protein
MQPSAMRPNWARYAGVGTANKNRRIHCRAELKKKDESKSMKCVRSLRFASVVAVSCWASMISIVVILSSSDVRAEVHVSGSKGAVTVQAKNASLEDIIAAVNSALNVKISMVPAINNTVTGTYSGSLRRVFARMLAGHNYALSSLGDQIKIIIILATQAGTGTGLRPPAINDAASAGANVAVADGEGNTTGIQGWAGGYSPKSP